MRTACLSVLPRLLLVGPLALACAPTTLDTTGNRASNPQAPVAPLPSSDDPLRTATSPPTIPKPDSAPVAHHHHGATSEPSQPSVGGGPNASDAEARPDAKAIWSCPMHPEVRRNEPGRCPICGMNLVRMPASPGRDGGTP
jgi:hypothetical protein